MQKIRGFSAVGFANTSMEEGDADFALASSYGNGVLGFLYKPKLARYVYFEVAVALQQNTWSKKLGCYSRK